jgi:transcriptional regulator with XRE-family HTH domain
MANTTDPRTLGELIRDARVNTGRSLRDVAKALGITPSYQSDIENDRRVPSEEVLQKIADLLQLDFQLLMAKAGRFGEDTERYMRKHPTAGTLFRKLTEQNASEEELQRLLREAEELRKKRDDGAK